MWCIHYANRGFFFPLSMRVARGERGSFSALVMVGFALCSWSLAGLFIFLVSAGNLVPRAFATHRWYRARFPDYPQERRALVPFLL